MVGLVETTRYGWDIVDHGGAITSDGDLMILTEFGWDFIRSGLDLTEFS